MNCNARIILKKHLSFIRQEDKLEHIKTKVNYNNYLACIVNKLWIKFKPSNTFGVIFISYIDTKVNKFTFYKWTVRQADLNYKVFAILQVTVSFNKKV